MKSRALPMVLLASLALTGCSMGGPTDVAVVQGQKIGQAQVQEVVANWANDPLYQELAKILGEEKLKGQATVTAQQTTANRAVITRLGEKLKVTLPDDATVQASLDEQLKEAGGAETIQKQFIDGAKQTGMAQGIISMNQVKDQIRNQLSFEAITKAIQVEDAQVDAFLAQAGLPTQDITPQIRNQARQQVQSQALKKELEAMNIKINPRLSASQPVPLLGQTTQSPNADTGADSAKPIPGAQVPPGGQAAPGGQVAPNGQGQ